MENKKRLLFALALIYLANMAIILLARYTLL